MLHRYNKKPVIGLLGGAVAAVLLGIVLLFGIPHSDSGPSVAWASPQNTPTPTPDMSSYTITVYAKRPGGGSPQGHAFFKIARSSFTPDPLEDPQDPTHERFYVNKTTGWYPARDPECAIGSCCKTTKIASAVMRSDNGTPISEQAARSCLGLYQSQQAVTTAIGFQLWDLYDAVNFNCTHVAVSIFNFTTYNIPYSAIEVDFYGTDVVHPTGLANYISDVLNAEC